jgi:hypothetical protein
MVIGLGTPFFSSSVYNTHQGFNLVDSEFLHAFLKNIPFIFTLFGALFSLLLINCLGVSKDVIFQFKMSSNYRTFYAFLNKK